MSKKCFQDQKESTKLIEFCVMRIRKNKQGNVAVRQRKNGIAYMGPISGMTHQESELNRLNIRNLRICRQPKW